jgi:hypothetical protein
MSVPRLSFREPPLRIKIRKVPVKTMPEPDIESQELPPEKPKRLIYFIGVIILLVLMRIIGMYLFKASRHTIKKLKCSLKDRTVSCYGADPIGTFVVEIPSSCSGSVYDVGGYPFSVAEHDKFFKVPAKDLSVKDINGKCEAKAYIDSNTIQLSYPFTWVTTNQHTTFTLLDGNEVIVDKVSADLFDSVTRGPWIAYTYDIPGSTAKVIGDGSDIIHVYNGVSP